MKRPNVIKRLGKNKPSFRYEMLHKAEINNILKYIDHLEARIKELEEKNTSLPLLPSDGEIEEKKDDLCELFYNGKIDYDEMLINFEKWFKSQIKGIPGELSDEDAVIIAELIAKGQYESSKVFWKKAIQHFK